MSITIPDFWKLAIQSRLLSPDDCRDLEKNFGQVKGAAGQANARSLGEWLIANNVVTRFQAKVLMAGRPGPFFYGPYKTQERISGGRLAGGFKAIHEPTGCAVGLHFLRGPAMQDPQLWATVTAQVTIACQAAHPHLSRTYELVESGSYRFVVVEDLAGDTLESLMAARGPLPPVLAVRLLLQATLGLEKLHALGQVHGSIRPENIWIDAAQSAKLLQVPLSRDPLDVPGPIDLAHADPAGPMLKAADYLAPELGYPGRRPDALTDLYALGCVLYHALAGKPPFAGGDIGQKLSRHATQAPPPLEQYGVPQPLAQVVGYMLSKDPAARYPHAAALAEALAYFVEPAQRVAKSFPSDPTLKAFEHTLGQGATSTARSAIAAPPVSMPLAAPPVTAPPMSAPPISAPPVTAPPLANPAYAVPPMPAPAGGLDMSFLEQGRATSRFDSSATIMGRDDMSFLEQVSTPRPAMPMIPEIGAPPGKSAAVDMSFMDAASPAAGKSNAIDGGLQFAPPPMAPRRHAKRGKNKSNTGLLIGMASMSLVVIVGLVVWAMRSGNSPNQNPELADNRPDSSVGINSTPNTTPPKTPEKTPSTDLTKGNDPAKAPPVKPKDSSSDSGPAPVERVVDDGTSLWASPTRGTPLSLMYVPSRAKIILVLRPADLLKRPTGAKIQAALGPFGDSAQKQLETITGMKLADIDQLIVSFHENDAAPLGMSLIVRASAKLDAAALVKAWGDPTEAKSGDATYHQSADWSYYLPPADDHLIVIATQPRIEEVIANPDGLRSPMLALLPATDMQRHVTLLMDTNYLFDGATPPLPGNFELLKRQVQWLIGDDSRGAVLSFNAGDDFFAEVLVAASLDKDAAALAREAQERIAKASDRFDDFLSTFNASPYSRKELIRFSKLLGYMSEYARSGAEDGHAVLRCYLPIGAADHLVASTELALAERSGGGAGTSVATGDPGPKKPETVADKLKKKITLTFPRDTLEKSMEMLATEAGVKVEIIGGDLQLDGITKNQSFGLDEKDQPADAILRTIMAKANPDGKLVYIIKPKNPGEEETVFITTRAAVAKRGDKLPAELEKKPDPVKK